MCSIEFAILFIFFILLTFGFIFYARMQKSGYATEAEEVTVLKAIQVSEKAAFLPEIQCSFDNIPVEDCIDIEKLTAFSTLAVSENIYYYNVFGFSRIEIEQIYPSQQTWTLYDNPFPNYQDVVAIQLPTSLYYPGEDEYSFGAVLVSVYR